MNTLVYILQKEACKKRDRELITKEVLLIKRALKRCVHKTSNDPTWHGQPAKQKRVKKYLDQRQGQAPAGWFKYGTSLLSPLQLFLTSYVLLQITLPGMCSCFGWDKDGDLLAIITDKSPNLIIWDAHSDSGKEQLIDTSKNNAFINYEGLFLGTF